MDRHFFSVINPEASENNPEHNWKRYVAAGSHNESYFMTNYSTFAS